MRLCALSLSRWLVSLFLSAVMLGSLSGQTTWYVNQAATGTKAGTSWANAYLRVQDALAVAVAGDQIWVATGTYYPDEGAGQTDNLITSTFRLATGVSLFGGFAGNETDLSQRNLEANETILSGDLNRTGNFAGNCFHVVTADAGSDAHTLADVTITGGSAVASGNDFGGGLWARSANILLVERCVFRGNRAVYGGGAAISGGIPQINLCTFEDNFASLHGGACQIYGGSGAKILRCSFQGNRCQSFGGAVGVVSGTGFPLMENSVLAGNFAGSRGGAVWVSNSTNFTVINCSMQGNRAALDGGAVMVTSSGALNFQNTLVWDNGVNGAVPAAQQSIAGNTGTASYQACLFQHLSLTTTGSNNLNGTTQALAPRFESPVAVGSAPTTGADLRLTGGSPAIDAGVTAAGPFYSSVDRAGLPRTFGEIDLGAHEHQGVLRVSTNGGAPNDGLSWASAFTTVQDAMAAAIPGSEIWVARGTYYPDEGGSQVNDDRLSTFLLEGRHVIYGGFGGNEGFRDARSPATVRTVLSGDINQSGTLVGNSHHVFTANGAGEDGLIDGFTIEGGNADGAFPQNRGGGFYIAGGAAPRVRQCIFQDHSAAFGAAVDLSGDCDSVFSDCEFRDNAATTNGGALYLVGGLARPVFRRCSFVGSTAVINGGAVHLAGSTAPRFEQCAFRKNWAPNVGGAIFNSFTSRPVLLDCVFTGNATNNLGGAVFSSRQSDIQIIGCSFQGNAATNSGAAIYSDNTVTSVANTVIWDNLAGGSTTGGDVSYVNFNGAVTNFAHSLVQNINLQSSGVGNFNGKDPANDPRFVGPVDPAAAPVDGGNLRVYSGSPVIDVGRNSSTPSTEDAGGRARIVDGDFNGSPVVDIGAFEAGSPIFVDAGVAGGANDGSSWANAFQTLQDGMRAAQFGDEVWVAAGTYFPDEGAGIPNNNRNAAFGLGDGVRVYGGFADGELARDARDWVGNPVVLSGEIVPGGAATTRSFHVVVATSGSGEYSVLDGVTVLSGNADGGASAANGGGLYIVGTSPLIRNCLFADHQTTGNGGAIYMDNFSSPRFVNCAMQGNLAALGGGVYVASPATPTFTNCSWQGNRATVRGGAIALNAAEAFFTNCLAWNNQAGAVTSSQIASLFVTATATANFSHCLVENWDLSASGNNLDGTLATNDPRFVQAVDPALAPVLPGNLRLGEESAALDVGDGTANDEAVDLGGQPRVADGDLDLAAVIDLGAYERPRPIFVAAAAAPGGDGSSWTSAYQHLQSALEVAGDGSLVWVAEGSYYPDEGGSQVDGDQDATFTLGNGVAVYGGFAGSETRLSERHVADHQTILSGDINQSGTLAGNSRHVTTCTGTNTRTLLDGFVIRDGNSDGDGGGMLIVAGAAPRIVRCLFTNNQAFGRGGAVFGDAASPVFFTCAVLGNCASTAGGIYLSGGEGAEVANCTFQGNKATGKGGALGVGGASVAVTNTLIWENAAQGSTGAGTASVAPPASPFAISYSHCLVAGMFPAGPGNLDGTNRAVDPRLILMGNPLNAPTDAFDARLLDGSAVLDRGINPVDTGGSDLAGAARVFNGMIDIGAYEGLPFPEIAISSAEFGDLKDAGPPLYLGVFKQGDPRELREFTVSNLSYNPLAITRTSWSGTGVSATKISRAPPSTLAGGASGPMVFQFFTGTTGEYEVRISVTNSDSNEGVFDIDLIWVVASDIRDADGDGLSDFREYADGDSDTDPFDWDTDGDGASDGAEMNLATIGFDNGTDDSALLALIQANDIGLGLYTEANLQTLAVTQPVLSRNPLSELFEMRVELRRSTSPGTPFLEFPDYTVTKTPGGNDLLLQFAPPTPDAHFFRVLITEP